MSLTGFIRVNTAVRTRQDGLTGGTGFSPWQPGTRFQISGYDYVQPEIDGIVDQTARIVPVFLTTIGNLFLSMVVKNKIDINHNIVRPSGTFNNMVFEVLREMSGRTNGEILTEIVTRTGDRWISVNRREFVAITSDGRSYASSIIDLNFEDGDSTTDSQN